MEHFIWDLDPEIFRIGSFGPRYYGIMFAGGFFAGLNIMQWQFKLEGKNINDLSSLLFHVMLGTIIGARLGHCLFYAPDYYLSNPLRILYLWEGGLASHGGTIGVIFASWLYIRKHPDQTLLWLADRMAVPLALAAACIRTGNFFNSEIIGKAADVPWAIVFKRVDMVPRHPAMLYEAGSYLVLFLILFLVYRATWRNLQPGRIIGLMFIWIFGSRFFIEFFKENQVAFENNMPLNMGQILSIPFVLLGIGLFLGFYKKILPRFMYAESGKVEENSHSRDENQNWHDNAKKAKKKK